MLQKRFHSHYVTSKWQFLTSINTFMWDNLSVARKMANFAAIITESRTVA